MKKMFRRNPLLESSVFADVVRIVFVANVILVIATAIAYISPTVRHFHQNLDGRLFLAGIIFAGIALWVITRFLAYEDEEERWRIFGEAVNYYEYELPSEGSLLWIDLQGELSEELKVRAREFAKACKNQESFRDPVPAGIDPGALGHHLVKEKKLAKAVSDNKKSFWELHGAGKNLGFEVKPRFRDYL